MLSKRLKPLAFVALLILGALSFWYATEVTNAQKAIEKEDQATKFWAQSSDLALMGDLFKGGSVKGSKSGEPVTFDSEAARKQGFSPDSIQLAEQLAAFTNELMAAASKDEKHFDITELDMDLKKHKILSEYFDVASTEVKNAENHLNQMSQIQSPVSEYYCGTFWRPRPNREPEEAFYESHNPEATLSYLGFHPTAWGTWAGGGWTRHQSYMPWLCGFGTYRDHAKLHGGQTFSIQNYTDMIPRGEPNPELIPGHAYPWPYSYWPAYVYWWHETY